MLETQKEFLANGLTETGINNLKKLRHIAIKEGNPTVVRTLRLIYEHLEANESFLVAIPEEGFFEKELVPDEEVEYNTVSTGEEALESLDYILSLLKSYDNKMNWEEILYYRDALASME